MCCNSVHPFEIAGLGRAPFTLEGYSCEVGPKRLADGVTVGAPGQPMGTCDYCGRGIAHVFKIRSSDGKESGVGCDCVLKIEREDNQLVSAVKKAKLLLDRKARQAKAAQKAKDAREKRLQAQRDRNGGLTDQEVRDQRWAAELAEIKAGNEWLVSRLDGNGPFVTHMRELLERYPARELSAKQIEILGRIWVGSFGFPRESQAEAEAATEFREKVYGE